MASSTTGGVKAIRVGVLAKAVATDIQRIVLPTDAVVFDSYHSNGRTEALRSPVVRAAVLITLLYIVLYFAGAFLGMFYGYSIQEALFESTSAPPGQGHLPVRYHAHPRVHHHGVRARGSEGRSPSPGGWVNKLPPGSPWAA